MNIEGKGEVQIFARFSTARVPQCVLEVQRMNGAMSLDFDYRLQNAEYSVADQRLMELAATIVSDPDFQVSEELRQKLREALPPELSGPRAAIADVDDDTQSAWMTFATAKNDAIAAPPPTTC